MDTAAVDALLETASDGISFDGLDVHHDEDGFHFETSTTAETGLTRTDLRDLARGRPTVTHWYFWHAIAPQRDDYWTFLRWLEGLDGSQPPSITDHYDSLEGGWTRTWGQLQLTVTLEETGARRYEIRHVEDSDRPLAELEGYEDPLEMRELTRLDASERYRPLKTAPSLRKGWVYADLAPADCPAVVESCYPGTIANWYRERNDSLDITHWREAIGRQTGIYGVIETWDRGEGHEHVEWVAQACCTDDACLKRRVWQYDDETALAVDPGDGQFPCREPCSVVIAGARKWTRLEAEESQTYELELTPSEKAQLEAIVNAVADGETAASRAADFSDPANRYRARFLRAKRFDEDGQLRSVPTDTDAESSED